MSSRSLSRDLLGTWSLLSRIDETVAGERRPDPLLGEDPVALLTYDRSGHFAAQFMRRDRTSAADAIPAAASGSNNTRAVDGYDAYFGTYVVDDSTGAVTQTLLGALSRDNVGQVITRVMSVDNDVLTIRLETETVDGDPIVRTLTWQRLASA
jgi:hypothetical protein